MVILIETFALASSGRVAYFLVEKICRMNRFIPYAKAGKERAQDRLTTFQNKLSHDPHKAGI
jgi:hypothetical protein